MADKRIDIIVTSKVKDALSGLGRVASSVGKIGVASAGIAAGGIAAFSGYAIRAAANYETLQLRLEAVTGSAQKAKSIFEEIRTFAGATPLRLDDLIEARILLEGIGVTGQSSLRKAAEAAAALNKPLVEVASAVASLETEPLRRMGIEVRRVGDQASFSFRNKFGKEIKLVANGIDEARQALLEIFSVKFGGFLGKASESFNGLVSTLRDKMTEAAAQFGSVLLPYASKFVSELNAKLQSIIDSGFLEKMGERIVAAFSTVRILFSELVENIKSGSVGFADVFKASITALLDAGAVMGNMIGDAILRALADSGLPGTGGVASRIRMRDVERAGELNRAGLISDADLLSPLANLRRLIAEAETRSVLGSFAGIGSAFAGSLRLSSPSEINRDEINRLRGPSLLDRMIRGDLSRAQFGVFTQSRNAEGRVTGLRYTGRSVEGPAALDRAVRGDYVLVKDQGQEKNISVLTEILATLKNGIPAVAQ